MVHCYEAEAKAAQGEQEDEDDAKVGDGGLGFGLDDAEEGEGVPMEHLISCIKGLQVKSSRAVVACTFHFTRPSSLLSRSSMA